MATLAMSVRLSNWFLVKAKALSRNFMSCQSPVLLSLWWHTAFLWSILELGRMLSVICLPPAARYTLCGNRDGSAFPGGEYAFRKGGVHLLDGAGG